MKATVGAVNRTDNLLFEMSLETGNNTLDPIPDMVRTVYCECRGYTPVPSEVLGRRVGLGSTLQLHILPAHIPVAVIAQHQDVWSNCAHTQSTKGSFRVILKRKVKLGYALLQTL